MKFRNLVFIGVSSILPLNVVFSDTDKEYSSHLSDFDYQSLILTIPSVKINGLVAYKNIKLKLVDEKFEIVDIKPLKDIPFTLSSTYINLGGIGFTETGELYVITGMPDRFDRGSSYYDTELSELVFNAVKSGLSAPDKGVKGTHYTLDIDGNIAYATNTGKVFDKNDVAFSAPNLAMEITETGEETHSGDKTSTVGDLIIAENNVILEIVGVSGSPKLRDYSDHNEFYKTIDALPSPNVGIKGSYFFIEYRDIFYVNKK